jgi:hypothetical protein
MTDVDSLLVPVSTRLPTLPECLGLAQRSVRQLRRTEPDDPGALYATDH